MKALVGTLVLLVAVGILPAAGQGAFGLGITQPVGTPVRATGVRAVKLLADWSAIEATRGTYRWEQLDAAVAAAVKEGLQPIIVLGFTPRWASLSEGLDLNDPAIYTRTPPKRAADWERFVSQTVRRYNRSVKEWQVWTVPNLPHFRGTGSEYLQLVVSAQKAAAAVDPASRIVLASPTGMDLVHVRRALAQAPRAVSIISLTPGALAPEQWLRPLEALRSRILAGGSRPIWVEWSQEPQALNAGLEPVKAAAIARALGVERLFLSLETWKGDPRLSTVEELLATAPFAGYLVRDPGVFALVFGAGERATLLTWSGSGERTLEIPVLPTARVALFDGRDPPAVQDGKVRLALSPAPLVVLGVATSVTEEARTTQQQRGPMLPVLSPDHDFGAAKEVTARLGRANVEAGLYNILRTRKNGAVEPVTVGEEEAVRTSTGKEIVFVYFDVDDSFLFFNDGRFNVEVTAEVLGAKTAQTLGFNLFYDSQSGYKFTPWQWVDGGGGWSSYTFRLTDANFANTWGWDFAINAGGNRREDLTVRAVTVRKVPR